MNTKLDYKEYNVEDFVNDDKFRKWVNNTDETEQLFWEAFQIKYWDKEKTIQIAKRIVDALSFEEKLVEREEYSSSLKELKKRIVKRRNRNSFLEFIPQWWNKIAAIILLPFIAVSIYFFLVYNHDDSRKDNIVQYVVPNGQKGRVVLEDGTDVWLNSGSKLSYYLNTNINKRIVSLEGEAFFDVAHKDRKPFFVKTKDYTVKVYGTRFNVKSYPGQDRSETILEEGSVSILTADKQELKLKPGQRFFLNENSKYQIIVINPEIYTCWKNNVLKVNNEKLEDLITRMERWYGVDINVTNFEKVRDIRYTLTIKTESLREMFELMKYVTPFTYSIEGENVTLNFNL